MTEFSMTEWSDVYKIGIEIIDEQHKKFFRLAHHFYEDCLADEGEERVKSTLTALGNYAGKHFRTEEALMNEDGYPDLEAHKKLHAQFIKTYETLHASLENSEPKEMIVNQTLAILMDWLKEHIVIADGEYATYCKKNN